jgi:metal-dependent amidase/aminoacylase/carboxypeptidase family protein
MDLQAVPEPVFYRIVELRCAFHRKPELVFEEEHTGEFIIKKLNSLECPMTGSVPFSITPGLLKR